MSKTKLPPILHNASNAEYVLSDDDLNELVLVVKIISSQNYTYGYSGSGKYGTLTDNANKKTYRIKAYLFKMVIEASSCLNRTRLDF